MTAQEVKQIEQIWPGIAPVLFVPHNEKEYERLVAVLDTLIDVVGENESHPLASLMEVIGALIEKYEDEHVPEISEF
jgi:HTH-type transcriptional regulator / antitoxin HigA